MYIGIIYNLRPEEIDRNDPKLEEHIEGDEWKTIKAIGDAVMSGGHEIEYFPVDSRIYHTLEKARGKIDLLFNLSEGTGKGADREAQIPMIAEILGIPYTGPGPLSAALILNKSRAKEIWHSHGVRTAVSQTFESEEEVKGVTLGFPLIVKPNGEGSGIGIHSASIVQNTPELRKAIKKVVKDYHQSALVERYLTGREFTVGIIGNKKNLTVLPIVEINFAAFPDGTPPIDSYEAKFVYGVTGEAEMHETEICPAHIEPLLEKEIISLAREAYTAIGCRDFGRVDIRLDADNVPYVLEINHPPGLMSDPAESSFFTIASHAKGWDFDKTINKILTAAITRLTL